MLSSSIKKLHFAVKTGKTALWVTHCNDVTVYYIKYYHKFLNKILIDAIDFAITS